MNNKLICDCEHSLFSPKSDDWRILKNVKANFCRLFYGGPNVRLLNSSRDTLKSLVYFNFQKYTRSIGNPVDVEAGVDYDCDLCHRVVFTNNDLKNINHIYLFSNNFYSDLFVYILSIGLKVKIDE